MNQSFASIFRQVIKMCFVLPIIFSISQQMQAATNLRSFGNSITHGEGLSDQNDRFTAMFANYLGLTDLNGAISGMTLVNNNFYEKEAINDDYYLSNLVNAASDTNDYVLIMFGTNDLRMIDAWDRELDQSYVDQYREHLQLIVSTLLNLGFDNRKIFLLSDPYTQADEAGRDSVEAVTAQVAAFNNTLHLNLRLAIQAYGIGDYTWRNSYTDDSIHPNREGHQVIYEVILDAFIAQTTGCPVYNIQGIVTDEQEGLGDGAIITTVTGGMDSLTYHWNNGATTRDLENISEGIYSLTVTDGNSCTNSASFTVNNIQSVTFEQNCESHYLTPVVKQAEEYSNTVYIDPTYSGIETGSIDEPFNSWNDIDVQENTAYLIKSGTTLEGGISINANNNYIGKYGTGERPIVMTYLTISGGDAVIDSLNIICYGNSQYQKIIDLANVTNVTIANSYITGLVGSYDYPYYLVRGRGEHVTFYNNIMSGAKEDGMYIGSSPHFTFVRNWLYNTNMGGIDVAYGGDGIQLEYDEYYNAYIAGNIIDRSNTMSKFCLIINAEELTHDVVCEWNTFIAPKNGNGGAAVRWLGGENNKFNKNLIITYLHDDTSSHRISGIASYDVCANQEEPYGIRDNHFYGLANMFYGLSSYYPSNLGFSSAEEYATYLEENDIEKYGSNIDTSDFWNIPTCNEDDNGNPDVDTNAHQNENYSEIDVINNNNVFNIYPTPASNYLFIGNEGAVQGKYLVKFFSHAGELRYLRKINIATNKSSTISLEGIAQGTYLVVLIADESNDKSYSQIIVVD